jgi:PAS domain S-box-containing protein
MAVETVINSRMAAYELDLLARQSLSMEGVLAAAIHVLEPPHRLRQLSAACTQGVSHHLTHSARFRERFDVDELLSPGVDSWFTALVLANPGLHEASADEALSHLPPHVHELLRESVGAERVAAARLDGEQGPPGLMFFLLNHLPTADERAVIEAFVLDASRALDSFLRPDEGGRYRHRNRQRMGVLQAISEAAVLSKDRDLSTTLQFIVDRLRAALTADVAIIQLLSEDGQTALLGAASVSEAGRATRVYDRSQAPTPSRNGVLGWVARTGRPALVANLATDSRQRLRPGRTAESVIAAPLMVMGTLIGVLRVSILEAARFGPSELQLVELLAQQVAIAVENVRLYQSARDQNNELRALYQETSGQKNRLAVFGHMFSASPEAITLIGPDERIQECNPAAERLYGYEAKELIGQPVDVLLGEGKLPDLQRKSNRNQRRAGEWHGEISERRKDGSQFPAEVELSIVRDESGQPIGSIKVARDLTERKQMEAQFLQAEKLRSLGVMASGVAHQMNNVLASVVGQADVLRAELEDPAIQRRLDTIIQAGQDGAEAVRRIQRFSRNAPEENFEPIELRELLDDVVRTTAPRWRDEAQRKGGPIKLLVEAREEVWTSGLAAELREVAMNLVLNAVDALPGGGTITITVQPAQEFARLTIADDGVGMPESVAAKAFEPFFTTKPVGKGTGLGLALAYGTVQRHGGKIQIDTEMGRGTMFEILLPRISPPGKQSVMVGEPPPLPPKRVLVVDDEPPLANQLRTIFEIDGHEVQVCTSGEEALAAVRSRPFDLVLTDLGMPEVTGWDVAREAKKVLPNVRVGLVTGWAEELRDPRELASRGVDFVISKPYRLDEIRTATARSMLGSVHA